VDSSRDARPLAIVILIGCLLALSGVVWIDRTSASTNHDDPGILRTLAAVATTLPPTTQAPTTTAPPVTAPPPPPRPARPSAQSEAYDNGPVVQIGTIEIPKIGLVSPVFEGNTLTEIDHGPSHWPGTAMPGQVGNAVFAGHRVTHTHPFLHIDLLVPGDQVVFVIGGVRSVYQVTGHEVVTPSEVRIIDQTPTPTATLFGCHPPHSAKYRYVVHLALVSTG
jgi:sortase A